MDWEIIYYSEGLQNEISFLPVGIQARYIHLTDRMRIYGANLGMPHTKVVKDGLFGCGLNQKKALVEFSIVLW